MSKYTEAILQIVSREGEHLTAAEIFARLQEQYPAVVQATVYNNLNRLYEAGRIRRITMDGCPDRYDGTVPHDHLVCRKCGRLMDVRNPQLEEPIRRLTEVLRSTSGLEVEGYDLRLFYVCSACRQTEGKV